jgi:hypothetical protein
VGAGKVFLFDEMMGCGCAGEREGGREGRGRVRTDDDDNISFLLAVG